jgi:hypothetical protein
MQRAAGCDMLNIMAFLYICSRLFCLVYRRITIRNISNFLWTQSDVRGMREPGPVLTKPSTILQTSCPLLAVLSLAVLFSPSMSPSCPDMTLLLTIVASFQSRISGRFVIYPILASCPAVPDCAGPVRIFVNKYFPVG